MGVLAHIAHARAHTHTHVLADKQTHKQTDRQGHTRAMTRLHTSDQCAAWRHSRPTDPSQILRPIVKQLECSYSLGTLATRAWASCLLVSSKGQQKARARRKPRSTFVAFSCAGRSTSLRLNLAHAVEQRHPDGPGFNQNFLLSGRTPSQGEVQRYECEETVRVECPCAAGLKIEFDAAAQVECRLAEEATTF